MGKLKHKWAKLNIGPQELILTVDEIIRRNYSHKDLKAYNCRDVLNNPLTIVKCKERQNHLRIYDNGCGSHGRGGRGHVDYNPSLSTEHLQAQQYIRDRIEDIDIFTFCPCCQHIVKEFIGTRHDNVELEQGYINNHNNDIRVDLVINNEVVYEVYNTHKTEKESRECDKFIYGGEIIASHIIKTTEDAGDHSRISLNATESNIECIKCDEKKAKEAIRLAKDAEKTASAIRIQANIRRRLVKKTASAIRIQANIRRRLMKNVLLKKKEAADKKAQAEREAASAIRFQANIRRRRDKKKAQAEREAAHKKAQAEIRKRQREARYNDDLIEWNKKQAKKTKPIEPPLGPPTRVTYQDIDHLDDDAKNWILQFIKIFCDMETYEWKIRYGYIAFDDEEIDIPRRNTDSALLLSFLLGKIVPKIKNQGDASFRISLKKEVALRNSNATIALIHQRVGELRSNCGKECKEFDMKITYAAYSENSKNCSTDNFIENLSNDSDDSDDSEVKKENKKKQPTLFEFFPRND